jgi:hypothetical protein
VALALAGACALASPARADEGDTVYRRLDADLVLGLGLGGGIALGDPASPDLAGAATVELRARILDTGGLFVAPEWRPEGVSRVLVGADFRPLFLMRFLNNLQSGNAWLDLLVDSIGLDLGVAFGPLSGDVGLALAVGGGLDVPLFAPEGVRGGVFLRLATRWVGAHASDQLAPPGGADDVSVLAVLSIRGLVNLGLARWEGARYRAPEPL